MMNTLIPEGTYKLTVTKAEDLFMGKNPYFRLRMTTEDGQDVWVVLAQSWYLKRAMLQLLPKKQHKTIFKNKPIEITANDFMGRKCRVYVKIRHFRGTPYNEVVF